MQLCGGELCNGSTYDSDSYCLGSNPSSPAIPGSMVKRLRRRPLKAKSGVRFPLELPTKNPCMANAMQGFFVFVLYTQPPTRRTEKRGSLLYAVAIRFQKPCRPCLAPLLPSGLAAKALHIPAAPSLPSLAIEQNRARLMKHSSCEIGSLPASDPRRSPAHWRAANTDGRHTQNHQSAAKPLGNGGCFAQ